MISLEKIKEELVALEKQIVEQHNTLAKLEGAWQFASHLKTVLETPVPAPVTKESAS